MRTVALLMTLAALGCDKGDKATAASPGSRDVVIETWKKAGLTPSPMTAATVAFGKDCQSGTVNSVDVIVCTYGSPADANAAEPQGWEWVGSTTGSAWVSGSVLIAAADRRKSDPSGRTINQLMKLAPK